MTSRARAVCAPVNRVDSTAPARLPALMLVIAVVLAYANVLPGPFVFDDRLAILGNASIRTLAAFPGPLDTPAGGSTVSGRPVVNFSLALNYAIGGTHPWSYHLFNVALHAAVAVLLLGVLRHVLVHAHVRRSSDPSSPVPGRDRSWLAFVLALLWALHPLQTAAVSYVVQRAEVLAALFGLATLVAVIRDAESDGGSARWKVVAVLASFAAAACKETAVAFPLVVLLYDRTFLAGSFGEAIRRRPGVYAGLAASWILILVLVLGSGLRGGTVGADGGIATWHYLLTQMEAIVRYIGLVFWPSSLVFDYGTGVVRSPAAVVPQALVVFGLITATVLAWLRGYGAAGFAGAAFFLLLAPSSSVIPIATQTIAEHRMYLPSAVVLVTAGWGLWRVGARWAPAVLVVVAVAAGGATVFRNQIYRSEVDLWRDTVAKRASNPRAHANLGAALLDAGRTEEAIAAFQTAVRMWPEEATFYASLSMAQFRAGRSAEAYAAGEQAATLDPASVEARVHAANAALRTGQLDRAIEHAQVAWEHAPEDTDVRALLTDALIQRATASARRGDLRAAALDADEAVGVSPGSAEAWFTAGNVRAAGRQLIEATEAYRRALALDAQHLGARNNLANALLVLGRPREAIVEYEAVLRVRPGDASVRANLQEARSQLEANKASD